jgi:hypothetical protein
MSLQRRSQTSNKPIAMQDDDFMEVSEKLFERDFFPELYRKRLDDAEILDLTDIPSSSVGLNEFNDQHIPKSTSDFQQSLSVLKSHRHERMYGIRDQKKLNNFMFNHPGLNDTVPSARPRVNYANTRFPDNFRFEEVSSRKQASKVPSEPVHVPPIGTRGSTGDILERGRKRKGSTSDL